jgi:regulator of RNase E activity RraA
MSFCEIREMPRPDENILAEYVSVARCFSASCVFADVQGRAGVMHSSIKPIFACKLVGPALTVKLSPGESSTRSGVSGKMK